MSAKKREGLLVLVLVLLVVEATGLAGYWAFQTRRRPAEALRKCGTNLETLASALEMYSMDHSGRYPTPWRGGLRLLVPRYLKSMPTCPAAGGDTYTLTYEMRFGWGEYSMVCAGAHHVDAGQPAHFPQYDNARGLVVERAR